LSVALVLAASAQAMGRQEQGSGNPTVSLQVNFGTTPHWVGVEGTSVQVIREGERPGYDMFRYGSYYYVYNNNRWYRSTQWRGRFILVDDRSIPSEFRRVPRNHWHSYPSAWEGPNDQGPGGTSAYLQVNFGTTPRWAGVQGTRVEEIPMAQRPGYDVFRYGGSYYAYNNNRWYSSSRETGNFAAIDDRSVPSDLRSVPREHWRNYPSAWQNQNQTPPGLEKKGGIPPGQDKKTRDNRSNGNGR
jgi:hypothetical protein